MFKYLRKPLIRACYVSFCLQKDVRVSLEEILQNERRQEGGDSDEAFIQLHVDTIQVFSNPNLILAFT